jgi:AcrR family transcriptional regulator
MADKPYRTRIAVRVLEIAERVLETEGLPGLQARRIAKEADCAVGTLYNIFGDIDGLVVAANARTLHAFGRLAEAAMQRTESTALEDRLMSLALAYLDFAIAHRLRLKAVFDHQLADPEGEVSAAYLADQSRLFALIEAPLEPFIADAKLRANAARAMFAAVHGIVAMAIDRKLGPFDAKATEQQVRFVVGAMAKGVRG